MDNLAELPEAGMSDDEGRVDWECQIDSIIGPVELGIRIDRPAAAEGFIMLSSVIEITDRKVFTGEVLAHIAAWVLRVMKEKEQDIRDKYKRLWQTRTADDPKTKRLPTAISVFLAGGRYLFISSSARRAPAESWTGAINGTTIPYEERRMNPEWTGSLFIIQALRKCELLENSVSYYTGEILHQTHANCAEMLCLHLWSMKPTSDLTDLHASSVVTVWRDGSDGRIKIKPPCEGAGCDKVLKSLQKDFDGLSVVTNEELPWDLDDMPKHIERLLKGEVPPVRPLRRTTHYSIIPDPKYIDKSRDMEHRTHVTLSRGIQTRYRLAPAPTATLAERLAVNHFAKSPQDHGASGDGFEEPADGFEERELYAAGLMDDDMRLDEWLDLDFVGCKSHATAG